MGVNQSKKSVYILDTSFVSPLGKTPEQNMESLIRGDSAIEQIDDSNFFSTPILISKFKEHEINEWKVKYAVQTRFDAIMLYCADQLKGSSHIDFKSSKTLIILSTTKGNIELLQENVESVEVDIIYSAKKLQRFFENPNEVLVVSNACISGVSASIIAMRYLRYGNYEQVVVLGCDAVSHFILSGFDSFKAISKNGCKPFDVDRDGVVLGEAAGAIVYSCVNQSSFLLCSGSISNDANHISGPSKTGAELANCIQKVVEDEGILMSDVDFVLAHGTATPYNDEMESKALDLSGVYDSFVFGTKSNYGHTLGASGVIEIIISLECLKRGLILPNKNFKTKGVSGKIRVCEKLIEKDLHYALKTASGFGGCNAAVLLKKQ